MPLLTVLGSGSSYGVPAPGCNCRVCSNGFKPHSRKYRTRCSALIESNGKNLLIDVSQDFREQALKNRLLHVDSCLITHSHVDAILGLPDLRSYSKEKEIPIFAGEKTIPEIQKMFGYIFEAEKKEHIPKLILKMFPQNFSLYGLDIVPVSVVHPPIQTFGFRINDLAYLSDIKTLPLKSKKLLEGIKTLVLGATGPEKYFAHQSVLESINLAEELNAEKTFFTHLGHGIDSEKLKLPAGMQLAYDGLKIKF